ncbi:MAG: hypothetical protein ACHP8B_10900 [Terriglobales bacterium]
MTSTPREQLRAAFKASIDRMLHLPAAQRDVLLESLVDDAMRPPEPAPQVSEALAAARAQAARKVFE